jgi:predicted transposase YdaD
MVRGPPPPEPAKLWTATYLLMGLCFEDELAAQLLEGVQTMRESTTYQAILREGRNEGLIEGRVSEAQRVLLSQEEMRFGVPDEATRDAIEAIRDVERLEKICLRILDENILDWNGLLVRS